MNTLASYSWIKEYLPTLATDEDFAAKITATSIAVEHMTRLRERFEGLVIGIILSLEKHQNADRLQVVGVDIGDRQIKVVCGGTNLLQGMRVVVALPGSWVRWHGEGELIKLEATEVRGVKSEGMICAPAEVGFEKVVCGPKEIWDVTRITQAAPGTTFADALDLDDTIFDVEVTGNRVDCMGVIGMAREGAAVLGEDFSWKPNVLPQGGEGKKLNVRVEANDLCPRYLAVVVDGVHVGPSPFWLQKRLLLLGERPINNIVDITNYVRLEYGQPLHAFDYDKLARNSLVIRRAVDGEAFTALDKSEHKLTPNHLVIADGEQAQAVAGVMGGELSGTGEGTKTIVFEAATFDPISIRRTSRDLNLYSDSQLLFEKGISTGSPVPALARALELTKEIAGGEIASEIFDISKGETPPLHFPIETKKIRAIMGVDISDREIYTILEHLGFRIFEKNSEFFAEVPYWRDHDIEASVDFAEEVARIYGYGNIPARLPGNPPPMQNPDPQLFWEAWVKQELRAAGYSELFSNSCLGQSALTKYDLDPADALRLYNPLSSDFEYLRPSLLPSLLLAVETNEGLVPEANVFELSRVYLPRLNDLPLEKTELVISNYGKDVEAGFLKTKGTLEHLAKLSNLPLTFERLENDPYWHPTRSAAILLHGERVGVIGEVDEVYRRAFGIRSSVVVAHLLLEDLIPKMHREHHYHPAPQFPAAVRDLSFIVDDHLAYEDVREAIRLCSPLLDTIDLVDVYQGLGIADGKKSLTLTLALRAPDRTLSSEEADAAMGAVGKMLETSFGAILR
ncbi:MAG: phenylalanine--tRNA ligase subunit beta [Patescibacteria group bacterium]|jgi:phenylalanyl-tRNA synthetase beta chain